jgi:hypothetical protein
MGTVTAIITGIATYAQPVLSVLGAAAAAAAWLPHAQPNTAYALVRSGIDWLGQNYGNARNITPFQAKAVEAVEDLIPPKQ